MSEVLKGWDHLEVLEDLLLVRNDLQVVMMAENLMKDQTDLLELKLGDE